MDKIVRPMLACSATIQPNEIDFTKGPVWVTPKLDGVRALVMEGGVFSRKLKLIPNTYIQESLSLEWLHGLDGELIVGDPTASDCINSTTSGVMSRSGEPDFSLHVFDLWNTPNVGYRQRHNTLRRIATKCAEHALPITLVPRVLCHKVSEVEAAVGRNYESGYEGSIVRCFDGRYKYNRSTLREGLMLKIKESIDSEIRIESFEEMMHNANEATIDERGYTKRSAHKANKIPAGTLGLIHGTDIHSGEAVTIGPGKLTAPERSHIWKNQKKFIGKIAKYRYAAHGIKDKPRFPRWIAWRDEIDL